MSAKLRVGLVGLGDIARVHAEGWAHTDDAVLVAGSDVNPAVLDQWTGHGLEYTTTDPDRIFADPSIDVVDVCAPNNYHAPLAIAAMEAGKHVLCEKPLAPSPGAIRQMIEERDRAGVKLMTAQHFRFTPTARALKVRVDRGDLGDVYHARCWMLRRAAAPVRPGFILKEHSGGGPIIDIGVHILDLALWLMGSPRATSVSGVMRTEIAHQPGAFSVWGGLDIPQEFDVEDFAAGFVRFDSGASLMMEVSWMLHHPVPLGDEDTQIWLYGSKGGAHWPSNALHYTDYAKREFLTDLVDYELDEQLPYMREIEAFVNAVLTDGPSPVPAEESLEVALVLEGIQRSQESGGEVTVDRPETETVETLQAG